MSENKKSLINLVPDSVDNAVKNITDKPTQNIGTTLADIWYLVFGGISQVAEKRKLKYFYAIQEFEKELEENISKIPKEELVEPDIQIIAPALESAKYCIEKATLRHMFAKLITNSLNNKYSKDIHPIYINIISTLTPIDAKILLCLYNKKFENNVIFTNIENSLDVLSQLGLIIYENEYPFIDLLNDENVTMIKKTAAITYTKSTPSHDNNKQRSPLDMINELYVEKTHITTLGRNFINMCL